MRGLCMAAYNTELPIRADLDEAHAEIAARWATTGSWSVSYTHLTLPTNREV